MSVARGHDENRAEDRKDRAEDRALRELLATPTPTRPSAASPLRLVATRDEASIVERLLPQTDIAASETGIRRLALGSGRIDAPTRAARRLAEQARDEIAQYLRGERSWFDVAVDLGAAQPFQREVLRAASEIPLGEVRTYAWIAARIGKPGAVRAVGNALGANPVPLLVPCHRVVRSDGTMGGYSFGSIDVKRQLLLLERATPALVGCTSTRIVCRRGCRYERRVAETNRIVVASVAEARAIGYRPCAVCRPTDATGVRAAGASW
ncbi:MAG TPA: methylated-DNA--[protein]-cysteine S-methyltransferase [Candidatus Binatia bacterium]